MIEWFYPSETPTEKCHAIKIFSIDVLIFHPNQKLHSVGWYNFRDEKWEVLTHEKDWQDFAWRFFQEDIDKDYKDSAKLKWYYPSEIPDIVKENCEEESIDVLIYAYRKKYHAIGNFNYQLNEWKSIFNEQMPNEFYWRYLEAEFDEI